MYYVDPLPGAKGGFFPSGNSHLSVWKSFRFGPPQNGVPGRDQRPQPNPAGGALSGPGVQPQEEGIPRDVPVRVAFLQGVLSVPVGCRYK